MKRLARLVFCALFLASLCLMEAKKGSFGVATASQGQRSIEATLEATQNALITQESQHTRLLSSGESLEDIKQAALSVARGADSTMRLPDKKHISKASFGHYSIGVPLSSETPLEISYFKKALVGNHSKSERKRPDNVVDDPSNIKDSSSEESARNIEIKIPGENESIAQISDTGFVVYQNTMKDVDTVVQILPFGGARILTVIHSQSAAQSYSYLMTMPEGCQLVDKDGRFGISYNGEDVMSILSPWAWDAKGQSVPVSYQAVGNTLVMSVQHFGYAYPVVADPTYMGISMNDAEYNYCKWPWNLSSCLTANTLASTALSGLWESPWNAPIYWGQ